MVLDPNPLAELKRQIQASVESVCEQACRRMDEVAFVPEKALEAADAAVRSLERHLNQLLTRLVDEGLAGLSSSKQRYFEAASAAGDLDQQWRTQLYALAERLASLAREAEQWIEQLLGPLFTRLGGDQRMFAAIRRALQDYVVPLADWLQQTAEEIAPFELCVPDWSQLENFVKVLLGSTPDWSKELLETDPSELGLLPSLWNTTQLKEEAAEYWRGPILKAQGQMRTRCDEVRKAIESFATLDELIAQLPGQTGGFTKLIEDQFKPLSGEIKQTLANLQNNASWSMLAGQFDQANNFVTNAEQQLQELANIFSGLESSLHDVANEVTAKGAELLDQLGAAARHIEHAITEQLRDNRPFAYGSAAQQFDLGLATRRGECRAHARRRFSKCRVCACCRRRTVWPRRT